MRRVFWLTVALATLVLGIEAVSSRAVEPRKKADPTQALMQRKLKESQKALEGLAMNDFKKIADSADELLEVSKAAEWKIIKNEEYEMFSNEFRRRVDQMGKAAREKNIDGATLAYMEMTMTCVRCHKHVREVRRAEINPSDAQGALGE